MASYAEQFPAERPVVRDPYLEFEPISLETRDRLYASRVAGRGEEDLYPKPSVNRDGVDAGDGLRYPDPEAWLEESR